MTHEAVALQNQNPYELDDADEMRQPGYFHSETLSVLGLNPEEAERSEAILATVEASEDVQNLLGQLDEVHDPFTREHSERVGRLAVMIGIRRGLGNEDLFILGTAGYVHDVGKREVQGLIYAQRFLTDEEREIVGTHSAESAKMIAATNLDDDVRWMAEHHHSFKKRDDEPQADATDRESALTQVLATADVADSLLSERPYRSNIKSFEQTFDIIQSSQNVGDPNLEALRSLALAPEPEPVQA